MPAVSLARIRKRTHKLRILPYSDIDLSQTVNPDFDHCFEILNTRRQKMLMRTIFAVAVALPFLAGPVVAQVAPDADKNAHHYSGGPATGTPHMMNHPRQKKVVRPHVATSHHYSGGPQNPSHHMGDKKE
jgi:hypothetical protein